MYANIEPLNLMLTLCSAERSQSNRQIYPFHCLLFSSHYTSRVTQISVDTAEESASKLVKKSSLLVVKSQDDLYGLVKKKIFQRLFAGDTFASSNLSKLSDFVEPYCRIFLCITLKPGHFIKF